MRGCLLFFVCKIRLKSVIFVENAKEMKEKVDFFVEVIL